MLDAETTPDLGNRLRQLQALWKEVGPMPQRRSKELWEQFKATCDQVYDKVKGFRAVEAEKFVEVAKVKEALIAEAEVLAESTDWAATADKLKALQARWKESGHLPRKQGDELWKRFRAACDRFFERRKPQLDARHAEEADNLGKKQALIARAQAVADAAPGEGGWGRAIAEIKELQREWKDIGYVPRRDADAVYRAFRAACDALFAKRDAVARRRGQRTSRRARRDQGRDRGGDGGRGRRRRRARDRGARARSRDARRQPRARRRGRRHGAPGDRVARRRGEGTELDPAALRARRDKLIAKAEELLPKQAQPARPTPRDLAAQLKARDAVERVRRSAVLRPRSGRGDRRAARAVGRGRPDPRRLTIARRPTGSPTRAASCSTRSAVRRRATTFAATMPAERGGRRRRRRSAEQPVTSEPTPAAASATGRRGVRERGAFQRGTFQRGACRARAVRDGVGADRVAGARVVVETRRPRLPGCRSSRCRRRRCPRPRRRAASRCPSCRRWTISTPAGTLGESDPTATAEPAPPSSSEMAGDGATGGDGIDEPGWD